MKPAMSSNAPDLMLVTFALLAPLGIVLALLVHAQLGGVVVLISLGLGIAGLHRLGRSGSHQR